jgi:hypothetical protein
MTSVAMYHTDNQPKSGTSLASKVWHLAYGCKANQQVHVVLTGC